MATRVAGFQTWRTLGRCVRKGEKGIAILLPVNVAPYQVLVQIAAEAFRLRVDICLAEFRRDGSLQEA